MTITGTVFNIQRYSIHDGPGVRTTVFLKGCPLSCLWCHNPEGISRWPEVIFRENRCTLCGDCVDVCPQGVLSILNGLLSISDDRCDCCGSCERACPAGAVEIAGKEMSVEQVMAEVERDVIFYDQSGGGVTFSGGEPLFQPSFLRSLLLACREHEIRTAVDTTGFASPEVVRNVIGLVDLFLFDLKAADDRRHRELTGVGNVPILENLRMLAASGACLALRVPIVPGVNDDEENILAIGEIGRSLRKAQPIHILPYHSIATEKYRRLRRDYRLAGVEPPPAERMSHIVSLLGKLGLVVTIGG